MAVADGAHLLDFALWRPGAPDGVGDIHRGRVIARVPAMAGAFLALAGGAEGFLPDSSGGRDAHDGDALRVRVVRAAQGGKGPRLMALGPDSGPPALLERGQNAVERLAALHPGATIVADDAALAAEIAAPVTVVREPWDDALASAVDALDNREITLQGGARLSFHPTPALVAIDVDAGAAAAKGVDKRTSQAALNRRILPALAAQIRLRNLSGAILVDLAGMTIRSRGALGPELAQVLADDPLRPRLLGFTALGLAEILRPRVHAPLHELRAGPHAAGLAALRDVAGRVAIEPARAWAVRAAPGIVAALQADPVALSDLARRSGRSLILRSDPTIGPLVWKVETA